MFPDCEKGITDKVFPKVKFSFDSAIPSAFSNLIIGTHVAIIFLFATLCFSYFYIFHSHLLCDIRLQNTFNPSNSLF